MTGVIAVSTGALNSFVNLSDIHPACFSCFFARCTVLSENPLCWTMVATDVDAQSFDPYIRDAKNAATAFVEPGRVVSYIFSSQNCEGVGLLMMLFSA